jgi:hypothetical protein
MTPARRHAGELAMAAARARVAERWRRFCAGPHAAMAAAFARSSRSDLLEALAASAKRAAEREARRAGTATARRLALLEWLEAGALGPLEGFDPGAARRALKTSTGTAQAAAKLTGEPINAFVNAQRERARGSRRKR